MKRYALWFFVHALVACGGLVPAEESATSSGDGGCSVGAASGCLVSDDASLEDGTAVRDGDGGTFSCSSLSGDRADSIHCSLATQFCAADDTVGGRACQPFGTVCRSCECLLRALQDPDVGDAYVPFEYAPPKADASGCYGDAATGVTLYLSE